MADITLEDLRIYAAEVSSADVASVSGDREIQHWINKAIQRLWRDHEWNWQHSSDRIFLDMEESGTALNVTQDSRLVVLTGSDTFAAKYLAEQWNLHVAAEGSMTFELSNIAGPQTATLKEGHNWASTTQTGLSYAWSRHIYPLPSGAKQVIRIELMQNRLDLRHLSPGAFDQQRQTTPTQRGNDPIFYTFRKHRIEIWPAPGTQRKTLLITYRRGPTIYDVSEPNATVVDWEGDWVDLLQAAITLEASITQGNNAPVPYPVAMREYEDCLATYRDVDGIQDLAGPCGLVTGGGASDYSRLTDYPSSIPEQS